MILDTRIIFFIKARDDTATSTFYKNLKYCHLIKFFYGECASHTAKKQFKKIHKGAQISKMQLEFFFQIADIFQSTSDTNTFIIAKFYFHVLRVDRRIKHSSDLV